MEGVPDFFEHSALLTNDRLEIDTPLQAERNVA